MYKSGIILVMVTVFACGGPQHPAADHAHDDQAHRVDAQDDHLHNTGAIQLTLFSETTEFFIEYEPLKTGKRSAFLVHVTDLQSYRPYTGGSLTITAGGQQVTAEAPARPGIFEVPFAPVKSGKHPISYTLQSETLTTTVKAHALVVAQSLRPDGDLQRPTSGDHSGCSGSQAVEDGSSTNQNNGADPACSGGHDAPTLAEGEVIFLKEQAWKSDFMVQQILPSPFSAVLPVSGEIMAVPSEKTGLSATTPGILLFRQEYLVPGTRVEKGQPLFTITPATPGTDNLALQYNELKNSLEQGRSEFLRHRELFAAKMIPERQFIATKTAYTADSLRFYNLASRAGENGLTVIAPAAGFIHELHVTQGQFVQTGLQLATISANRNLLLRADLPVQHYNMAQNIVTANFRIAYSPRIYRVEELSGTLLSRGTSVSGTDHFIPLYFSIINDGTLLEGSYVELFLLTEERQNSLTVPVSALTEEQGTFYCYVQVTGESFTKRSVKPGRSDGQRVEITGGLQPGERVVTRGAMLLKAASMVAGESGHGHAH
ncbi:MAG: efflux RND transporter periplasmic adaptor subunit [Bacteroidales bacterium]